MSERSPLLDLPFIQPSQAQKHVTHNEALNQLDVLVQLTVDDFNQTQPPSLPQNGSVHALGAGASGAWAGQDGMIAAFLNLTWVFVPPRIGWRAFGRTDNSLRVWTGATWQTPTPDLDNLEGIGIATSADPTNRLAVASEATLFTHAGAGHQLKVNKAAASDTASLLLQSGWSGRAEMGLAGDDHFSLKVSADGSTWHTALTAQGTDGALGAPQGLLLGGTTPANHLSIYETGSHVPSLVDQSNNSAPLTGDAVPYVRIGNQATYFFGQLNNLDTTGLTPTDDIGLSLPFLNGENCYGSVELRGSVGQPGPYHWQAIKGKAIARIRSLPNNNRLTVADITSGVSDIVGGSLTVLLA
ncbi:DUF2793 domain-containing protein [Shimia sp.]|uniref:DUF2793 domain-containing protein n=1 Tax=Shimia sp. TaxID=1954381 RepID=UPI0032983CDC